MNQLAPIKKLELIKSDFENNKQLVTDAKVHEFIELKIALEAQIKAAWKALETYMIENDIKDLDVLTIAEKAKWSVDGQLPPRFYKQMLDTSELNHLLKQGRKLPKGASYTMGSYMTKTNRKVEV